MGSPKIKDSFHLNKAVKMLKESADATWCFVFTAELKLEDVVVCVFADSSFADTEGLKSQCGFVVALTSPKIKEGTPTPIFVMETYSGSVEFAEGLW